MSTKIQAIRGMNDVLPDQSPLWEFFEDTARAVFRQYGYRNIRTPIVEHTELFVRGVGQVTDIVEKEMYSFTDAMNGEQLPLLNGFPLRLVVPGWYSTYWVKMLSDIEVLDKPDDGYWMKTAYRIPDVPGANIKPGQTGFKTVPINRMVPRSFVTNLTDGAKVERRRVTLGPDVAGQKRVLTGLQAGERVVVAPSPKLENGQRVRIADK